MYRQVCWQDGGGLRHSRGGMEGLGRLNFAKERRDAETHAGLSFITLCPGIGSPTHGSSDVTYSIPVTE